MGKSKRKGGVAKPPVKHGNRQPISVASRWKYLDPALRLRLADLDAKHFEDFFLHFLNAGVELTVQRNGKPLTRRVVRAETYAAGGGKEQRGIDLRLMVEGGEVWCMQCKRHKKWTPTQTKTAIKKAAKFTAKHYILSVACDPGADVHDEVANQPNWTLWNLDAICAEFRLRVPSHKQAQILSFIGFETSEIRRFVGLATQALISPDGFFSRYLGEGKTFRHDWKLVGRESEMQALAAFLSNDKSKVLTLVSKGGDGKSRLLWEFTRDLEKKISGAQVLFFNPHSHDAPDFAFHGDATLRLLIIEDAHRTESLPNSLLAAAAADSKSKIIFAMRPQGLAPLSQKLFEVGLDLSHTTSLSLSKLKKPAVTALAEEALGNDLRQHAPALVQSTADCPFLVVVAGDLLRRKVLSWGAWASDQEFRQHVFRAFENENLRHVPDVQREVTRGLLRLVALLAPCTLDAELMTKAARCLSITPYEVETLLQHLQRTELIASVTTAVRIVPDLFGDFLVYDACFEPSAKRTIFVQQVLAEFRDASAELLRNLAEATWIAQANGIADSSLLNPLIDNQQKRFKEATYWDRAQILKHWGTFGVFLPQQTIDMVRLALALEAAPSDSSMMAQISEGDVDSHAYVLQHLPALLEPIARFHKSHLEKALDLLWEIAPKMPWHRLINNQSHPFGTLGELLKFGDRTSITMVIATLTWLEKKVQEAGNLALLETTVPVLHAVLHHCFARFVEFREWRGRTLSWWEQPVSPERTAPVRDQALRILDWVMQHGSWLAALDALDVAAEGIRRVGGIDIAKIKKPEEFRELWRPERIKALGLYERATASQTHAAVRYQIRKTLTQNLAYEEDPEFANECRRVLKLVPDDLSLQTVIAILSQGHFDFDDERANPRTEEGLNRAQELWKQHVRGVAEELARTYTSAWELFRFLDHLGCDLSAADQHPFYESVFGEIVRCAPSLAFELGKSIIAHDGTTPLARAWVVLVTDNAQVTNRSDFFRQAISSKCGGVRAATIRSMTRLPRDDRQLTSDEQTVLLELAKSPDAEELRELLQFTEWAGPNNIQFAYLFLNQLPLEHHAVNLLESIFEALVPHQPRQTAPDFATVEKILGQLVRVPRIDMHRHSREWDELCDKYPKAIYRFIFQRIECSLSGSAAIGFDAVPEGYRSPFDLPKLKKDPEFPQICDELWTKVDDPNAKGAFDWLSVFHAVVLNERSNWLARLLQAIANATSIERLEWLAHLIKFDGSLIIFREPDLTRSFLQRAHEIGGAGGVTELRPVLYSSSGPRTRGYTGGVLDEKDDYVEAEASLCATAHQNDPTLGSFYKWVVDVEQRDKAWNKARVQAEMADED